MVNTLTYNKITSVILHYFIIQSIFIKNVTEKYFFVNRCNTCNTIYIIHLFTGGYINFYITLYITFVLQLYYTKH